MAQADLPALFPEYGIVSLAAMAWLVTGWWERSYRHENAPAELKRKRPVA